MVDDDFAKAVADVRPLKAQRRTTQARTPAAPIPRQRDLDERAALLESIARPVTPDEALESGEELVYLREGVPRQSLRRLRQGHWVVQANLDLHGMNRLEAADQVALFLREALRRGLRCVRIVHGKGLGSINREPVLKNKLRGWLANRDAVLAYSQAPLHEGGSGAVLVLLNTKRR